MKKILMFLIILSFAALFVYAAPEIDSSLERSVNILANFYKHDLSKDDAKEFYDYLNDYLIRKATLETEKRETLMDMEDHLFNNEYDDFEGLMDDLAALEVKEQRLLQEASETQISKYLSKTQMESLREISMKCSESLCDFVFCGAFCNTLEDYLEAIE